MANKPSRGSFRLQIEWTRPSRRVGGLPRSLPLLGWLLIQGVKLLKWLWEVIAHTNSISNNYPFLIQEGFLVFRKIYSANGSFSDIARTLRLPKHFARRSSMDL
jgi:hypothetical protein